MRPIRLTYVRLAGTRQMRHPTSGQAKPVLEGADLEITCEDGLVSVLSLTTKDHISFPLSSVEWCTRAEWPVKAEQAQGQRR